jgi:uncharacterized protein (TIGR03067 family)
MTTEVLDELMVPPVDPLVRSDVEKLQGTWVSVEGRREAEFTFTGRRFTVRFRDGDVYAGAIDLVPDERPRTMIMWIAEGPTRHRGKAAMCIYELEGDRLCWCPSEPGADDPPAEFPPCDDPRHICTVLRRDTPPPKKG